MSSSLYNHGEAGYRQPDNYYIFATNGTDWASHDMVNEHDVPFLDHLEVVIGKVVRGRKLTPSTPQG